MRLAGAIACSLLAFLGGTAARGGSGSPVPPSSPGGIRLVENGVYVYSSDYIEASATVTLSGCYSIVKNPNGLGQIVTMTWSQACPHTFLDVAVTRVER